MKRFSPKKALKLNMLLAMKTQKYKTFKTSQEILHFDSFRRQFKYSEWHAFDIMGSSTNLFTELLSGLADCH